MQPSSACGNHHQATDKSFGVKVEHKCKMDHANIATSIAGANHTTTRSMQSLVMSWFTFGEA